MTIGHVRQPCNHSPHIVNRLTAPQCANSTFVVTILTSPMVDANPAAASHVVAAILKMVKLDIAKFEASALAI